MPYQVGEVFVFKTQDEVQEAIEKAKENLEDDVKTIEEKSTVIKSAMTDLKTHLYAKFGNAINLEADED